MISWNRLGTGILGVAGSLVAALMGYTLFFAGWRGSTGLDDEVRPAGPAIPHAAIFLPDRRDWIDFRQAVAACGPRGIAHLVGQTDDRLIVRSPRTGRKLEFRHHDVRGVADTRAEVRELADESLPPVAVVGSTTTVLTVALAEPLRDRGDAGPVLLIPWATAVMVQRSAIAPDDPAREPVPLMEVDPARTFRFCPNNRRLADSVVDCLVARDGGRLPGRVFLVVDPFDPYSDDLAACFRQAIRSRKPDVEIVERADAVDLPGMARPLDLSPEPSSTEVDLADAILAAAPSAAERPTWVVLPLQDHPARRMIAALRRRGAGRPTDPGSLRIVCGDAIERRAFDELAVQGGLSIWCASTSSARPGDDGVSDDTQALAEIVSALVWAVDQASGPTPGPAEVAAALRRIDLPGAGPAAFGRRLAFDAQGERRGDPERVLSAPVVAGHPVEYARAVGGAWVAVDQPSTPPGAR